MPCTLPRFVVVLLTTFSHQIVGLVLPRYLLYVFVQFFSFDVILIFVSSVWAVVYSPIRWNLHAAKYRYIVPVCSGTLSSLWNHASSVVTSRRVDCLRLSPCRFFLSSCASARLVPPITMAPTCYLGLSTQYRVGTLWPGQIALNLTP